jgi:hypothetical protein
VVGGGNCSTNGLGANQWVLGYMYDWRKEAKIFAGYYKVTNDDSGTYTSFPTPSGSAIAPGADTQGFGLGVLVTF